MSQNLPQSGQGHALSRLKHMETGLSRFLPKTTDSELMEWWSGLSPIWKAIFWINLYFERNFPEKENIFYIIEFVEGIFKRYKRRTGADFDPDVLNAVTAEDIRAMRELKVLDCAKNGLKDISPLVEVNMTYLDLSANHIQDLSPIRGKKNIKKLDVNNNPLTDDNNIIGTLSGLEIIWINATKISLDPKRFRPLKHLRFLRMSSNRICDGMDFERLTQLDTIICSLGEAVDPAFFQKKIPSLQKLDVPNPIHKLGEVPPELIKEFLSLNPHVKLSFSKLESL